MIYPFIVNNPGEAVQAKRRLAAVTIGHLTPPLSAAGLHGPLADLEGLVEEYAAADGLDPRRLRYLGDEIVERAWSNGLAGDCGLVRGEANARGHRQARRAAVRHQGTRDARQPACLRLRAGRGVRRRASAPACWRRSTAAAWRRDRRARRRAGGPTCCRPAATSPRSIRAPSRRAPPRRSARARADEVVRRYLQDHGDHPRALVIDLWASASLRTGGDDLAQAFAYLGVRPVWDKQSSRVTGIEVMPLATLDRPRIDVTLRISGLFRDIFETQIALFDLAVRRVAALDEDDADNPLADGAPARRRSLARVRRRARQLRRAGRRPGARRRVADARGTRARPISPAVTHAYGGADVQRAAGDGFRASVSNADVLVHPQDDRERDLLDGDGVADFAGGFAAAAAMLGNTPELYHLDTSQPEAPKARRIAEEIARVVRGRLTNPRWIAGMLDARPSRRRRDRPGRRCALCLRRHGRCRAGPSVRCHARRADRRRGGVGRDAREESARRRPRSRPGCAMRWIAACG